MKKLIKIILVLLLMFSFNHKVDAAANTLADLKKELQELKYEKAQNDAAKNKTQSEINAENSKISSAHNEVEKAEEDINQAKIQIENSTKEIENMKQKAEEMLTFYQLISNDSSFLDFVGGASSATDVVMRSDAINQIIEYTQNELKKMQSLIEENQELQVDLVKKQNDLEEKIKEYESSLASLKNDLSSLVEVTLDISEQIAAQEKLIKYYEDIGCKDNDLLSKCVDVANSSKFLRPTIRGYISSGFGWRSFYLNGKPYSDYHPANDIAGNAGGTQVYATAAGTVAAVISKASCGGNQVYIHVRVQGVAYTLTYAHLMDVYVKVGDVVTQQTVIGTVGGGGKTLKVNGGWDTCSTGYHLHYAVTKGFYLGGGSEGYTSYSKYISNSIQPPNLPAYGKWYYSRY
ncbi:MAG: peptidoglycan DD-metalloendopeptidase family protein [bacterium]|nr:peptidoglycan DD-metalloendopeptidase family protein [bacterium]